MYSKQFRNFCFNFNRTYSEDCSKTCSKLEFFNTQCIFAFFSEINSKKFKNF